MAIFTIVFRVWKHAYCSYNFLYAYLFQPVQWNEAIIRIMQKPRIMEFFKIIYLSRELFGLFHQ